MGKLINKLSKFLTSRFFFYGLIILGQLFWINSIIFNLYELAPFLFWAGEILSFIMVFFVLNANIDGAYKTLWVFVIMAFPIIGGGLYFVLGNKRPAKKLTKAYYRQKIGSRHLIYPNKNLDFIEDEIIKGQVKYLGIEDFPASKTSDIKYYATGEACYIELIEALKQAKHFIFMEYFIIHSGKMLDGIIEILVQKAREGVEVRFLYDDFGSVNLVPKNYYKGLKKLGIQAMSFNQLVPFLSAVMNYRDHRKITIVDGMIGFCGGFNLSDEYINEKERFGYWKDTGVRVQGDAVWNLTRIFLETWNVANKTNENFDRYHPRFYLKQDDAYQGIVVPYADSPLDDTPVGSNVYLNIINTATKYIYITTPYLILNQSLEEALILAAKRGVDVRICTPGIPDKKLVYKITRSYYENLTKYGVRIYEYSPGFMHAKSFVADDKIATVGTINLDYRSLFLHFECGVYFSDCLAVMDVKKDFLETIDISQEISHEMVIFNRYRGFIVHLLRILSPLL